ncbi:uncharacterized protein LOC128200588 [Galleria mellonella]|uniref:Uncharacterized protein LOC128200588 n=1 Tax=Galleria mellonella TaxID=7137 RepID=A0ABM3MG97_GALME|nr:uncharacterized protein LOC128200588 [Galleria mellonella]
MWHTISTAVRKPVRLRRLGTGGKRKTTATTSTTTTTVTDITTIESSTVQYKDSSRKRDLTYGEDNISSTKVKLPHFMQPFWKYFEKWKNLHRPVFAVFENSRESKLQPTSDTVDSDKYKLKIPIIVPQKSNYRYMLGVIPSRSKRMKGTVLFTNICL